MPDKPKAAASTKARVVVTELQEVDVTAVSLVERGANQLPFRIMKAENQMGLDLSTLWKRNAIAKADEEAARTIQLAAIGINKAADVDGLLAALAEKGFDLSGATIDRDSQDTAVLVKFQDFDPETSFGVQFADDVVGIMSDTEKMFSPFGGSSSFAQNVQAMGFVPGLHQATDALMETTFNILGEADTKKAATDGIAAALDDFSGHVKSLANTLPDMAFKLDGIVPKKAEAKDDKGASAAQSDDGKDAGADKDDTEKTGDAKPQKAEKAGDVETPDNDDDAKKDETAADDVLKGMFQQFMAKMDAGLEDFRESLVKDLDTRLETVTKSQEDMDKRLKTAEEKAEAADEALGGTVLTGSHMQDESLGIRDRSAARKSLEEGANGGDSGLWDTAIVFPGEQR